MGVAADREVVMVHKMVVTFAALQDAERTIRSGSETMHAKLDELAADLGPLTGSWTGEAAEAYQAHMREWRASAADLADVLGRIAGMVRTAESNYHNAVTTNQTMWPTR
jgi:WXG100 family type VII secretion target